MKKDLINYKVTIDEQFKEGDEDLGWDVTAFTNNPAIKVKGMAFKDDVKRQCFKDEKKMRIAAPAIIPSTIYRNDEDTGEEYTVTFTAEEIEKLFAKKMKNFSNKKQFNLEHMEDVIVPAYILEIWIVGDEPEKDRSFSEFGVKVPKGSIFVVSQITDREFYDILIENDATGFSVEGFFGLKLRSQEKRNYKAKLNIKTDKMKKSKFSNKKRFNAIVTDEEKQITVVAEEIKEGEEVAVINEELEVVEDFTGEVVVEGEAVKIEEGKIEEVVPEGEEKKEEEKKEEEIEASSDKKEEEEKKDEEKKVEEVKAEDVAETVDLSMYYTKEEVDAKFNELMELIAEKKVEDVEEIAMSDDKKEEVKLSLHERFAKLTQFSRD